MNLTIVIPSYNSALDIERCLTSIAKQNLKGILLDVIVVDDGSTDESPEIVRKFIAEGRLLNLRLLMQDTNTGRFEARLRGVKEAIHPTVMFMDTKIELPEDCLQAVLRIGHFPLIATQKHLVFNSVFDHLFYLVRRRVYFKEFPKVPGEFIILNEENFDRCPKGIADFICSVELLLNSLPENVGKHSSDDTSWIKNISTKSAIMIHNNYEVIYHSRSNTREVVKHLFERGPKFVDYYFRLKHPVGWIGSLIGLFFLSLFFMFPKLFVNQFLSIFLVMNCLVALFLSYSIKSFLTSFVLFPIAGGVFGAGVLWGLVLKYVTLFYPKRAKAL